MTYGKLFWLDAMERAVKSAAQAPLAAWTAAKMSNLYEIDLKSGLGIAGFAFIFSLLTSIGSAQVGNGNNASLVKSLALWIGLLFGASMLIGCSSSPVQQATELRALYNEALTQVSQAKADPSVNQARISELQLRLQKAGPWLDKIETAAAKIPTDPGQVITFGSLIAIWKPEIESALISLVIKRYLGS